MFFVLYVGAVSLLLFPPKNLTLKNALLNLEKINFFDGLEVVLKKIRTNFEQKVFKV